MNFLLIPWKTRPRPRKPIPRFKNWFCERKDWESAYARSRPVTGMMAGVLSAPGGGVGGDKVAGGVRSTSVGVGEGPGGLTIGVPVSVGVWVGSVPVAVGVGVSDGSGEPGVTVMVEADTVPVGVSVRIAVAVGVSVKIAVGVGVSVIGGTSVGVGVSASTELFLTFSPTLIDPLSGPSLPPVKVNLAVYEP